MDRYCVEIKLYKLYLQIIGIDTKFVLEYSEYWFVAFVKFR